jgi:hypothetical protein
MSEKKTIPFPEETWRQGKIVASINFQNDPENDVITVILKNGLEELIQEEEYVLKVEWK